MTVTDKASLLREVKSVFQQHGISGYPDKELIKRLGLTEEEFRKLFKDRKDLLTQMARQDMADQRERHARLSRESPTAVDEILTLIHEALENVKDLNPAYFQDLIGDYPDVWALYMENLNSYTYSLYYEMLNRGIRDGIFRRDINIEIVTKVILENVSVLLNTKVFPPERYEMREVMRCIYMYYIRGLCTDESIRLTEKYFASI